MHINPEFGISVGFAGFKKITTERKRKRGGLQNNQF
ncbi:MAG: hypothetical protein ACI8P3_002079 [Saprospiraceae bacterium]